MGCIRKTFSFPPEYSKKVKIGAHMLGISESELLRRAIDEYLLKYGFLSEHIQKIKDSGGD